MADLRNRVIGGFRIIDDLKLGSGSEGTVYKAVCETARFDGCPVGTVVALKTMMAQDDDHRLFAKLEKRTNELVRLNHPNVVRYFGCFSEQSGFAELHVIVEEFLEGETLKERLLTHPAGLDVDEAIMVIKSVIAGLSTAASKGIYHRDVKPANIFMCADGSVKLIDFEVARQEGGTTSTGGAMVGTFDYMAPDFTDPSFRGDEMSDIFSAGVVMHEAIAGRTPYQKLSGGNAQANFAFLSRWAKDEKGEYTANPISISSKVRRLLSHGDEVLAAALSPDRSKRFARFSDFVLALGKIHFRELRNPGGGSAYQLLQIVGRGGFGEVFKARDRRTGRPVAIKHLLKQGYAERFRREAKVMAKLVDPCFVRFIEFFETAEAGAFIVMDFLDGMPGNSLRDAIRRAKGVGLDRKDVLYAFVRYAHALALMHASGKEKDPIYHRDIKPSNLYFPERRIDNAALMDFGIAKDMGGTMTVAGTVPGTLDYMPPEIVLLESRGDAGVDIYALGLCLYEALSGKMAYPRVKDDKAGTIAFMSRATKKLKPNFDDPSVTAHPEILDLLAAMTDPDATKRLGNAREVELRLARIAGIDPLPMEQDAVCAEQKAAERAVPQNDEGTTCATRILPQGGERETQGTAELPVDSFREALRRERRRLFARRLLRYGLPCALFGAVALSFVVVQPIREFAVQTVSRISGTVTDRREAEVRETAEKGYRAHVERAERESRDAISKYDDAFPSGVGDAAREAWIRKWTVDLRAEDLKRLGLEIDAARDDRANREAKRRASLEKAEAEKAYAEALQKAKSEAEIAGRRYADEFSLEEGDAANEAWQRSWKGKLAPENWRVILAQLKTERDNRLKRDKAKEDEERRKAEEKRVADERARAQERQKRIVTLKGSIENLLKTEPISGRGRRLEECERTLAAQETVDLLDEKDRSDYTQRLTAEKVRVVGTVRNLSAVDFKVGEGAGAQEVKAKGTTTLDFPKGLPTGASLSAAGYEVIRLTRDAIDGKVLTIGENQPVPEAVAVTVPDLGEGVSCLVGGKAFGAGQKLHPGKHEYRYLRADSVDQSGMITVEVAVPTALPKPASWQDTPGFAKLKDAEVAEKKGEWERVETLLASAEVVSPRNKERKMTLEKRLAKHKEEERQRLRFERSLREAKEYFSYNSWSDVLKTFADLRKSGYVLTAEDRKMCSEARDNGTKSIDQRIRNLKYWDKGGPKEDKMRAEIRQMNEWYREVTGE